MIFSPLLRIACMAHRLDPQPSDFDLGDSPNQLLLVVASALCRPSPAPSIMMIDPKDLRRLIIRVVAVTLALRALHLFSVDLGATEVAAAWGLPADGHTSPVLHQLLSAWRQLIGGVAAMVRAPALLADVALPLVAVAYARANGWGTLAGLMAGLILAVAPFGLDEGWRGDASPWLALAAFAALWQLRAGLRRGDLRGIGFSSALVALGTLLSPMTLLVVPAGLYATVRSVALARTKQLALAGWLVGSGAGVAGVVIMSGSWLPGVDQASMWLLSATHNGGLDVLSGPMDAAWQTLVALSPGGASGGMATLVEAPPAPLWRGLVGALLWPLALTGFWRGLVREDRAPDAAAASDAEGAGAADGWRSLGVAHSTVPRALGDRDALPLLLPMVGAMAWAAFAVARGDAAGISAALAVARPFAAMFLGLGVTACALMPLGSEELAPGKRAVPILVAVALLQFGLGAHHTFVGVQDPSRMAPTKVARFVAGNVSRGGEVVALGLGGMQVAWRLGPFPDLPRVHRSAAFPAAGGDTTAVTDALMAHLKSTKTNRVAVVGDRAALEAPSDARPPTNQLGRALHTRLKADGFTIVDDGHRVLERLSVRVYEREGDAEKSAPSTVKPQLFPGQEP